MAINQEILTTETQHFIRSEKARKLLADGVFKSPFNGISPTELAAQIKGYRKALSKLPRLAAVKGIVYPAGISIEQCSSEETAHYKASIVPPGEHCADITGGFGSDTMALAGRFVRVDYFETSEELVSIAAHIFPIAGYENISVHSGDGVQAISEANNSYDLIYADPARRNENASRVFSVADCTPDISAIKDALLEKSPRLLVKLSPMLDITATLRLFPETTQIHVVSLKNEVKELLFLLERNPATPVTLYAADLYPGCEPRVFSSPLSEANTPIALSNIRAYVYDPSAALRKAGLADAYCHSLGLEKIHPRTSLYTSDLLRDDFQGRIFRVCKLTDSKNAGKDVPDGRASVIARNYPITSASLSKKYKLKDSDLYFLLAFRDREDKNTLVVAEKIIFL